MKKTILVAEDEETIREGLTAILADRYDVTPAASGDDALSLTESSPFDLILSDVRMPGLSGIELFRKVKKLRPGQKCVFLTVSGLFEEDPESQIILSEKADGFLGKPYRIPELFALIEKVLGPS